MWLVGVVSSRRVWLDCSGWNLWVWLECIGVVSGYCCKEVHDVYILLSLLHLY